MDIQSSAVECHIWGFLGLTQANQPFQALSHAMGGFVLNQASTARTRLGCGKEVFLIDADRCGGTGLYLRLRDSRASMGARLWHERRPGLWY